MARLTTRARTSRRLATRPALVFDAWLDPDAIRGWMPIALRASGLPGKVRRVEIDARVGGRFLLSDEREEGEAVHWGTYRRVERPERLVFTWWTSAEEERDDLSTVTLELEPDGDGTLATMTHEMDAAWSDYAERVEAAWAGMLEAIDAWSQKQRGR